jgi:hypothetical protein
MKMTTHFHYNNDECLELYLHSPRGLSHNTDRHTLLSLTTHHQFSDQKSDKQVFLQQTKMQNSVNQLRKYTVKQAGLCFKLLY